MCGSLLLSLFSLTGILTVIFFLFSCRRHIYIFVSLLVRNTNKTMALSPSKSSQKKKSRTPKSKKEKKTGERKKPRMSKNGKRISKSKFTNYARFIHRILPKDTRISARGMAIVNSFVHDIFERLASEAGRVTAHAEHKTISSQAVMAAVKLQLPIDFAQGAIQAGAQAINHYADAVRKSKK